MKNIPILLAALISIHTAHAAELFGTVEAVSGEVEVLSTNAKRLRVNAGQKYMRGKPYKPPATVKFISSPGTAG